MPDVRVTIGMPLYNNESTVARALKSLLSQTHEDLKILASDDGSRDATYEIVAGLAQHDPRIQLVRQPRNLNYGNFRYVVHAAKTPFFMFAAGDDHWHPTFIARSLALLDAHPEACCVAPRVEFEDAGGVLPPGTGTYPLTGSVAQNIAAYVRRPQDNSRMYGLFRTAIAQRAFPATDHFAFDWTFSAATLRDGQHLEIPEVLLTRDYTPSSRYVDYVERDNPGRFSRLFPLLPMTMSLLFEMRVPRSPAVLRSLLFANLEYHLIRARTRYPRYAHVAAPLLERWMYRR